MINPLLNQSILPHFSAIKIEHIIPALEIVLNNYKQVIENVIKNNKFNWNNLCQPLEEANNKFYKVWSPICHLNAVKNSKELREVYDVCLTMLSEFDTWMWQNKSLYEAYKTLIISPGFNKLNLEQRKSINNILRDFKLSGIHLSKEKKNNYGIINKKIIELENKFNNNVLDATMGWTKLIKNKNELLGIPKNYLSTAKSLAISKGEKGWLFTLDITSYLAIITYADNDKLRKEIYYAYNTRASDQGPNAGKWDNSNIMDEILKLRYELSKLLGFNNFAEKSLSYKMAKSTKEVLKFLNKIKKLSYLKGKKEIIELNEFIKKYYNIKKLKAWDLVYYSEKQKQHKFLINNEKIRNYFPEWCVINGLFKIIYKIYGLIIKEYNEIDTWHPDVRFFKIYNEFNDLCGSFYLDLYSRENKRNGAWMSTYTDRLKYINGEYQKPIAYLICNFNKPNNNKPILFTHNEVITLFHEFGHVLHHVLTKVSVSNVAGINGVPLDAIELPSQFMENWCWQPEGLKLISSHYKTNKPLPKIILKRMLEIKNYQSGIFLLKQLEFGLFDLKLHIEYSPNKINQILSILKSIKQKINIIPTTKWNRFPHTFSHIFAGNYSAGYYSYLWSEVLAADIFSKFNDNGIFNRKIGLLFIDKILSCGGTEEILIMIKRFLGRKPNINMMLKNYNII